MNRRIVRAGSRSADVGLLGLRIGAAVTHAMLPFVPEGTKILVAHSGALPLGALTCGALLVALGLVTRPVAALLALAWAWSFVSGLRAGALWSDWPLRSLLYTIIFAGLSVTGAGRFSLDRWIKTRKKIQAQ